MCGNIGGAAEPLIRDWRIPQLVRWRRAQAARPRAVAQNDDRADYDQRIVPPGLLWALGHVGYAIYPVYTRVIELVLMSFLFGWFMLRFGIITVIFAHVTLDAILMGMQMMFDGLPGDFLAAFSLIMPGLVGIVIWWLHRTLRGKAAI